MLTFFFFFSSFSFSRFLSMFHLCLAICYPQPGDMADLNCAYPCFSCLVSIPHVIPRWVCVCAWYLFCRTPVTRTGKAEGESIDTLFFWQFFILFFFFFLVDSILAALYSSIYCVQLLWVLFIIRFVAIGVEWSGFDIWFAFPNCSSLLHF